MNKKCWFWPHRPHSVPGSQTHKQHGKDFLERAVSVSVIPHMTTSLGIRAWEEETAFDSESADVRLRGAARGHRGHQVSKAACRKVSRRL